MNLSELAKTVQRTDADFEAGTIEYNGEDVSLQFKTVLTVADYEYIFMNSQDSQAVMAKRVVRLVRDADGTVLTLDDVSGWPVDLILAVAAKTVPAEQEPTKTKKNSGRK